MPAIPTLQRQQLIPATTGQPNLPFVQIEDFTGPAIDKLSGAVKKIGDDLFKAESDFALSSASTNAQIKLGELELELEQGTPADAFLNVDERVAEIGEEFSLGFSSPAVQRAFTNQFMTLSANSKIKIRGNATKKRYKELHAGLLTNLDTLTKSAGLPNHPKNLMASGLDMIEIAVKHNVIDAVAGQKLSEKFTLETAQNIITGYIGRRGHTNLMDVFAEMEKGEFQETEVTKAWAILDTKEQEAMRAKAITNLSRGLALEDKQDIRDMKAAEKAAKTLMLEFYRQGGNRLERQAILDKLKDNISINVTTFDNMQKQVGGGTSRFDNPETRKNLELKIFQTPHDVTYQEIIDGNLSHDVTRGLVDKLNARMDTRLDMAWTILASDPAFAPANSAEARGMKDQLNREQLTIWNQIVVGQQDAIQKGEKYDSIAVVKGLLKDYKGGEGTAYVNETNRAKALLSTIPEDLRGSTQAVIKWADQQKKEGYINDTESLDYKRAARHIYELVPAKSK